MGENGVDRTLARISIALPDGSLMNPRRKGITPELLALSGLVVEDYDANDKKSCYFPTTEFDGLNLSAIRPQEGIINVLEGTSDLVITGSDWVGELSLNPDYMINPELVTKLSLDPDKVSKLEQMCSLDFGGVTLHPIFDEERYGGMENLTSFLKYLVGEGKSIGCVSEKPFLAARFIYNHVMQDEELRDYFEAREPIIKFPLKGKRGHFVEGRTPKMVVVESEGGTEAKVKQGEYAGDKIHLGYEVVQSGDTLEDAGLKTLTSNSGEVISSEAGLYGGPSVAEGTDKRLAAIFVRDMLVNARNLRGDLKEEKKEVGEYIPVELNFRDGRTLDSFLTYFGSQNGTYRDLGEINGYSVPVEVRSSERWNELSRLYGQFGVEGFSYS